ncbi:MAG: ATP-binding protein [Bacteroidales bacterium]
MKQTKEGISGKDEFSIGADEYRVLFESTMDVLIVYDPYTDRVVMCNMAACKLFGYDKKECFMKLTPAELSAEYQPDGRLSSEAMPDIFKRVLKEGQLSGKWLYRRRGGHTFFADVQLTRIDFRNKTMLLASARDITEQARTEDELRDNMFSLDAAVNGTGSGLWDWNIANDSLILNDNWFGMLGFTRQDYEKRYEKFGFKTFADSLHPEDLLKVKETLKSHYSGEKDYYKVELRMKTADNDWKWILAAGRVCEWSGDKPLRMVGIHTDIDYRMKMEEKLKEAISKAQESERLKSAFLANLSHEIRTPMNGITGFIELLESDDIPDKQKKQYHDTIRASSYRLLDIVNDIMDMSKIEAGQLEIFEAAVNLESLFDEMYREYLPVMRPNVKFTVEKGELKNGQDILTDQAKIRKVFDNLISNAVKFTTEGTIGISCKQAGDNIVFSVADTGEGIDPGLHDAVFESFRQADIRPARRRGGTGLGLSICRAYVEKMGGSIWLESEKGKGSTFYFTLPYRAVEDKEGKVRAGDSKGINKGGVVLVVEDELFNYLFAEQVLKTRGYQVLHSETGREAIEFISLYPDISLVIMDIRLPDITGYEATRKIKQMRPGLPVIALTAMALSGDRESALEAGCDDYLKKPISKENLLDSVSYFM